MMNPILWIEHGHWKIRNGMLVYMFSIYAIFPWWYQGILFLLTLSPSIRNLNYNTFTEEKLYTIIVLSDYFIPWRPSSCALEKTSDAIDFYIKLNISVNLFLKNIFLEFTQLYDFLCKECVHTKYNKVSFIQINPQKYLVVIDNDNNKFNRNQN